MRIAILSDGIPPDSNGGAETIVWSLARGLLAQGHEPHVITTTRQQSFEEQRDGIATYHLQASGSPRWRQYRGIFNPATIGPLRALLARIRPEIVNAHNIHNQLSYWSLAIAKRLGIPTVYNAHDLAPISANRVTAFIDPGQRVFTPPASYRLPPFTDFRQARLRWNPIRNPAIRGILSAYTDTRVAISQVHAKALQDNGLPAFRVVYNGIDVDRFKRANPEAVRALRERLNLDGRRVVMFAGRLRRDKGAQELIRAMDALTLRVPDVTLLIAADIGYKQTGKARRQFERVFEKHVVETGWLDGEALVAAYHLADVLTVPSICLDPLVNINLEAMAAGKPVVATCFGGSPEAIADGETGYIINPFDTEQYAGRLEALLTDEPLRRRMGEAGVLRASRMFSLERYVSEMLAVYQEAAG